MRSPDHPVGGDSPSANFSSHRQFELASPGHPNCLKLPSGFKGVPVADPTATSVGGEGEPGQPPDVRLFTAHEAETLRSLFKAVETMQIGVTVTDVSGVILYANAAEALMHGYAVEE